MKKEALRFFAMMMVTLLVSVIFTTPVFAHSSGAPSGYTGSPGDGHNCVSCHGGSAVTVSGWITSNIPPTGYVGGTSYTVTVTATGTGKKGFELSPQNATGTQLGVLAAGTGSKLVGGTKYVTHTSAGASSGTSSWSFTWTAPVAGTGNVILYAAITVGEPNTKLENITIQENLVLPLAVVATATPSTINQGGSSQLHAAPSGGTGTYTYSWSSSPAGFSSTQQSPVVYPAVTTQYTVTVSDGSGTAQGNTTVTVNIPAPLTVIATANPTSITTGQSSQLNAIASGGTGVYTYAWTSQPAGFTSGAQSPTVQPMVTTKYLVNVNDGSSTKKDSVTVTVSLVPLTATASAIPSLICAGQTAQLNVYPAGGTGNYSYSWTSVPAGFTSTLQNPVVSPVVATQYNVHVTDGSLFADAFANVAINEPATAAAGTDTICPYVTTQVPYNGTAAHYSAILWTTSGSGTFSDATMLSGHYFPSTADKTAGNITLTLTASAQNPCTTAAVSTRHIHFDGPSGLADLQNGMRLVITPNPSSGVFTLKYNGQPVNEAMVVITDMQGKKMLQQSCNFSSISGKIDMTGFPKGLYLVKVQTEKETTVQKLVIE
ncbi:MAG: choice-of-anchor V domain-containing protein [Bacteroidota bacterium]